MTILHALLHSLLALLNWSRVEKAESRNFGSLTWGFRRSASVHMLYVYKVQSTKCGSNSWPLNSHTYEGFCRYLRGWSKSAPSTLHHFPFSDRWLWEGEGRGDISLHYTTTLVQKSVCNILAKCLIHSKINASKKVSFFSSSLNTRVVKG